MGIALVVIAVVLIAIAALGFLAWFLGWDAGRATRPLRASAEEAGERTADGIAEFRDWLRLGR